MGEFLFLKFVVLGPGVVLGRFLIAEFRYKRQRLFIFSLHMRMCFEFIQIFFEFHLKCKVFGIEQFVCFAQQFEF